MRADRRTILGLVAVAALVVGAAWWLGMGRDDDVRLSQDVTASTPVAVLPRIDDELPQTEPGETTATVLDEAGDLLREERAAPAPPGEAMRITGRVVDTARQPVVGARVIHWPSATFREKAGFTPGHNFFEVPWEKLLSTTTDQRGVFMLDVRDDSLTRQPLLSLSGSGVPRGSAVEVLEARPILLVEHPEHQTTTSLVTARQAGDVDVGDIVVEDGAVVVGRVLDEQERPVVGARLDITLGNSQGYLRRFQARAIGAETDAAGRFRLTGLWPGAFILGVAAPDSALFLQPLNVDEPGAIDLGDLHLSAGGRVSGRVIDAGGHPIPRASVRAQPHIGPFVVEAAEVGPSTWSTSWQINDRSVIHQAVADDQGVFTLAGLCSVMPAHDVAAWVEGYDAAALLNVSSGRQDLVLTLHPVATWRMTIVDESSRTPVDGAVVEARRMPAESEDWETQVPVERDGPVFVVHGAGRHRTDVVVSAPGFAPQVFTLPGLEAGEIREETLSLLPHCVLAGMVTDDEGVPVANARVALTDVASGWRKWGAKQALADTRGAFRIEGLAAGEWRIAVGASGLIGMSVPRTITLAPGEVREDLRVVLPHGAAITGVLLGEGRQPSPGARISAKSSSPEAIAAAAGVGAECGGPVDLKAPESVNAFGFTGVDGRFELGGLPLGHWTVEAASGSKAEVDLAPRQTVDVVLAHPQAPRVTGRVTSAGAPVPGALVELGDGPESYQEWVQVAATKADSAGVYELSHPDHSSWLYLRASNGSSPTRPVHVDLVPNEVVIVDIVIPTGRLRGRVVERGSGSMADVNVQLVHPDDDVDPIETATRSGADGSFVFDSVAPGSYGLNAGHKPYCHVMIRDIAVVEGEDTPEVLIELQRGGTVEVTLDGPPAVNSRCSVRLVPTSGQINSYGNVGRAGDVVRFHPVMPGDYDVTVGRTEGTESIVIHTEAITVEAEETATARAVVGA